MHAEVKVRPTAQDCGIHHIETRLYKHFSVYREILLFLQMNIVISRMIYIFKSCNNRYLLQSRKTCITILVNS